MTFRLSNKRVWVPIVILILCYSFYQLKWGYETFEIEDATRPTYFTYEKRFLKPKYITGIITKVKGELIGGQAVINVYHCYERSPNRNLACRIQLRGDGKIDLKVPCEFYGPQAYIEYKTRGVKSGNLSVSVSIR